VHELCHQEGPDAQMIPAGWREKQEKRGPRKSRAACNDPGRVTAVVVMHAHFVNVKIILDLKGLCAAANKTRICNPL
jgi:hypothetical protein